MSDEILQPAAQEAVDASMTEGASSTYSARVRCANCGAERTLQIPRGRSIAATPCEACGVASLSRLS